MPALRLCSRVTNRPATASTHDIEHLARALSYGLRAGIPLVTVLASVRSQVSSGLREGLGKVIELVCLGYSPAEAFSLVSDLTGHLFVQAAQAGLDSGRLPETLGRLALIISRTARERARLMQSLVYPAVLAILGTLVMVGSGAFVLPQAIEAMEAAGIHVPGVTRDLVRLLNAAARLWPLWTVVTAGWLLLLRLGPWKAIPFRPTARLPIIGGLLRTFSWSNFCFVLSNCLETGMSVPDAFNIASRVVSDPEVTSRVKKAGALLSLGVPVEAALRGFHPLVSRAITTALTGSGNHEAIHEAGSLLDYLGQLKSETLISMVQPVLTAIITLAIGASVITICLPVLSPGPLF